MTTQSNVELVKSEILKDRKITVKKLASATKLRG